MNSMLKIGLGLVLLSSVACNDEKRIAQLEARVKSLETKVDGTAVTTGGAQNPTVITPEAKPLEVKPDGPLPVMEFASTEHNFGTITEGQIVEHTYSFKNTGNAELIIENAQGSCGCTVPEWTKTPIPVGGVGFVKAKFDSNGKPNLQNKTVTVTANTYPKNTVLKFTAMVTPKAAK